MASEQEEQKEPIEQEQQAEAKKKNAKTVIIALAIVVAAVAAFTAAYMIARSDGGNASSWQEPKEVTLADGQKAMVRTDESGAPKYLTGTINTPAALSKQEAVVTFFNENRDLYGIENPAEDLVVASEVTDELGMNHIKMGQVYQGVPVYGQEMVVHFSADGLITTVNGSYKNDLELSVEAEITEEEAVAKALADLMVIGAAVSPAQPPRLVIFSPGGEVPALVYEIHVGSINPMVQMLYFIDAHSGTVVAKYDEIIN